MLGELQKLEVERSLRREQAARAEAAAQSAMSSLRQASQRVADLEQQRLAQLPAVEAQLVEIYKHGRNGYGRLLLGSSDAQAFGRLVRLIGALTSINEQRIAAHRRTLDELRAERGRLETEVRALQARDTEAKEARARAERAVTARAALIAEIDAKRDVTAQYVGELQAAYTALQRRMAGLQAGGASPPGSIPLAPFRGALELARDGRPPSAFGEQRRPPGWHRRQERHRDRRRGRSSCTPCTAARWASPTPSPASGSLVILDHGSQRLLPVWLPGRVEVMPGAHVERGGEVGRVGRGAGRSRGLVLRDADRRSVRSIPYNG